MTTLKVEVVKEGFVLRSVREEQSHMGRKMLKCINPEYLLKDPADFH